MSLTDSLRDFAREATRQPDHQPGEPWFTVMRQAVVTGVSAASGTAPTISIQFPEDTVPIDGVKYLHPYVPVVGDTVWIKKMGPDLLVTSKMRSGGDYLTAGDAHASPLEDFSSKGPNAGYNAYERGGSNRWAFMAQNGFASFRLNGSGAVGAFGTGGDLSLPQQVSGNGAGGLVLGDLGGQTHSRVFEATDSKLKLQPGSGNRVVFRDSGGTTDKVIVDTSSSGRVGGASTDPAETFDTGGGNLQMGAGQIKPSVNSLGDVNTGASNVYRSGGGTGHLYGVDGATCGLGTGGTTAMHFYRGSADQWLGGIIFSTLGSQLTLNGNKTFVIDHPTKKGRLLVHACLEGPEVAVYYRGEARTNARRRAVVKLPPYFEALTRAEGRTVTVSQVLADAGDDLATVAATRVEGGRFTVVSSIPGVAFSWRVEAVRADAEPLEVEPRSADVDVHGFGPYTFPVQKTPSPSQPASVAAWRQAMDLMTPHHYTPTLQEMWEHDQRVLDAERRAEWAAEARELELAAARREATAFLTDLDAAGAAALAADVEERGLVAVGEHRRRVEKEALARAGLASGIDAA